LLCFAARLRLGSAQTENLPILHAATIPLDLVSRVSELQQVGNIVRGLATPHAVAEHDGGFGFREVKQPFAFLNIKDGLHDLGDVDGRRAFGWV